MIDFDQLDADHLKGQRRYEEYLKVATETGHKAVSEMILSLYFDQKLTVPAISKKFHTSHGIWIYKFLNFAGFVLRPKGRLSTKITQGDSFKDFDRKIEFRNYQDKLKTAKLFGYQYVTQALVDMYYYKQYSGEAIGSIFKSDHCWVSKTLKKINLTDKKLTSQSFDINQLQDRSWMSIRDFLIKHGVQPTPKIIKKILGRQKNDIGFFIQKNKERFGRGPRQKDPST